MPGQIKNSLISNIYNNNKEIAKGLDFKAFFEFSPDAYVIFDTKGTIIDINKKAEKLSGYGRSELINKNIFKIDIIIKSQIIEAGKLLVKVLTGAIIDPDEYSIKRKDGGLITLEVIVRLIKSKTDKYIFLIFHDITSKKKLAAGLKENEDRYKVQFEEALDAIFIAVAETGVIIDCNRAAENLVERSKSEIVGQHQSILHPPERIKGNFSETFKKHQKEYEGKILETQVITKGGKLKEVAIKANIIELNGKRFLLGTFRDITEQKMTEEKYKESEEKHRTLYESSWDAIMTLEPPNWNFTSGNPATISMFGANDEKEFTSKTPYDLSPKHQPDGRLSTEKAMAMINKAMKKGSNYFEWTHKRISGEEFPTTVLLTKVKIRDKEFLQATVRDITQEKKAQQGMLKRAEELEKFNKLVVDRELKMVELKNKISELENRLKN